MKHAKELGRLLHRWTVPFSSPSRTVTAPVGIARYVRQLISYRKIEGAEAIKLTDSWPCFYDRTDSQRLGGHYFYQNLWALKRIIASSPPSHVDVGSYLDFIGYLTAVTKVTSVDLRPLKSGPGEIQVVPGNILAMPFETGSVGSLSCLHVAEHIGLGRYGDALDPTGTKKACRELARVLAPGGHLYFSLPVGRTRVQFNAHRVHEPELVLDYLAGLRLLEFSCVDDDDVFHENAPLAMVDRADYACGLFLLTKPR